MNWDSLISAGIIIILALGFWAKISKKTIPELIGDIIDMVKGKAEDGQEYVEEIVTND